MIKIFDKEKFGRLTPIEISGKGKNNTYIWKCLCDCGNICNVRSVNLRSGHTKSCGCLQKEIAKERLIIHGEYGTKEYKKFHEAKRRSDKIKRTPKWLTDEDWIEIKNFYKNCPKDHEVDHIIPLRGKLASGFHVLENLQYLHKDIHKHKINKFEPIHEINYI